MKKSILTLCLMFIFISGASAAREFIEGTDYFVDFKENDDTMAAVIHVNFISVMPVPEEAEKIVKDQLKVYGQILENEKRNIIKPESKPKTADKNSPEKEEERYKNIVGSAWYAENGDGENMVKVKFKEDLSAYVWLGKTGRVVAFPEYINFLKKEKEAKRDKDRAEALAARQQEQQIDVLVEAPAPPKP